MGREINFHEVSFAYCLGACYICIMQDKNHHIALCDQPFEPDDLYRRRVSHFAQLDVRNGDVVMLGDSLINCCEWHELMGDARIKNRGINGDTVAGVKHRVPTIMSGAPDKVFLMVGINDVSHKIPPVDIAHAIVSLVDYMHALSPTTRLYVHSLLPFDSSYHYASLAGKMQDVLYINCLLQEYAPEHHYRFIELYSHFVDSATGVLAPSYTTDGLHLTGSGYALWARLLQPYIAE